MNPKLLRLQVLLEEELRLDQWRINHMPLKSRSQAIARLIEKGMAQEDKETNRVEIDGRWWANLGVVEELDRGGVRDTSAALKTGQDMVVVVVSVWCAT